MNYVQIHGTIIPKKPYSLLECLYELSKSFDSKPLPMVMDVHVPRSEATIAFPTSLFEEGNIVQQLSVIQQFLNPSFVLGAKILNMDWPDHLLKSFPSPAHGIKSIREAFKIPERPLSAAIIQPLICPSVKECLEIAYHLWTGGMDIVMESELMGSLPSNTFDERIEFLANEQKNCSEKTKQRKIYVPNISARTLFETERRAIKAKDQGIRVVSINGAWVGLPMISSLRQICEELDLFILGQNMVQSAMLSPTFEFSAPFLAKIMRLLGLDLCAVPIAHFTNHDELKAVMTTFSKEDIHHHGLPVFPIMHSVNQYQEIDALIKKFGYHLILETDRLPYEHQDGVQAGAREFQSLLDASFRGR